MKTASSLMHQSSNLFVSLVWYLYSRRDFQGIGFLFIKVALQFKASLEIQPSEKKKDVVSLLKLIPYIWNGPFPLEKGMRNCNTEPMGLLCRPCKMIQPPGLFWKCSVRPQRKIFSGQVHRDISSLLYTSTAMGATFWKNTGLPLPCLEFMSPEENGGERHY